MRVAILGGGGFRVPLIHRALAGSGLPIESVVLQDVDAERLSVISAVLDDRRVHMTTDLDDALRGADLVFCAVRVGGLDGRVHDERAALELGVLGQETVGAGGLSYAMRAVPVAERQAARIDELAPDAWTITMTNPAGMVTAVMARHLGSRVIGVCDSPAALVGRAERALGVRAEAVDYVGINHLGWLRALSAGGVDRLPELLASPQLAGIEEAALFGVDLVRAIGAIPNEYVYWYYAPRESLEGVAQAGRTRGEHVRDEQLRFYRAASDDLGRARELWQAANDERNRSYFAELREGERDHDDIAAGGYETVAVALARALTGGAPETLILNVRNGPTLPQLPADVVVEVPCRVDSDGAHPLPAAPLSPHQAGLLGQVAASEQAVIEAALTRSPAAALRAFALHPLVGSLTAARSLAQAVIASTNE